MSDVRNIPEGWTHLPLRSVLRRRTDRALGHETLLSVTQTRGVIRQEEVGRRDSSNDDKSSYWRVESGDIVYNTMRMWQGVSGRSDLHGIVSPAYTVCEPIGPVDSRFLAYLFKAPESISRFYQLSQGLVSDTWNLRFSAFAGLKFNIPPISEQRKIAEILRAADAEIAAITELGQKYKLILERLVDQLLLEAGPTPQVPLESCSRPDRPFLKTGPFGSSLKGSDWVPSGTPVITIAALADGHINPDELYFVAPSKAASLSAYRVTAGDILFSRVADVGRSAVVRDHQKNWIISSNLMRMAVISELMDPDFLQMVIANSTSVRQQIRHLTNSSGRVVINDSIVRHLRFPMPPLSKQIQIVNAVRKCNASREYASHTLNKVHLIKQGLIQDLLTGRVRVSAL